MNTKWCVEKTPTCCVKRMKTRVKRHRFWAAGVYFESKTLCASSSVHVADSLTPNCVTVCGSWQNFVSDFRAHCGVTECNNACVRVSAFGDFSAFTGSTSAKPPRRPLSSALSRCPATAWTPSVTRRWNNTRRRSSTRPSRTSSAFPTQRSGSLRARKVTGRWLRWGWAKVAALDRCRGVRAACNENAL